MGLQTILDLSNVGSLDIYFFLQIIVSEQVCKERKIINIFYNNTDISSIQYITVEKM